MVGGVSLDVTLAVIFMNMTDPDLLDSAQVAQRLAVTIGTVYKLRTEDPNFPRPARYNGRSPLYDAASIDGYISQRSARTPAQRGRRPRRQAHSSIDPTSFAERLRASITAGDGEPDITSQVDLIRMLGLNTVTFGERMRSRTRWKQGELELIAQRLGMSTEDANAIVDAARSVK